RAARRLLGDGAPRLPTLKGELMATVAAPGTIASLAELVERALEHGPARTAVVQAYDPDVLEALLEAERLGLAEAVLVGPRARIERAARQVGYALRDGAVVETASEDEAIRVAIRLVREGEADLLMKGKVTTASLIRGVLDRDAGLRTGRLLSQVIVFEVPGFDRLMLMTDAAVNIAPTLAEKADICRNAIEVAHAIGIDRPNVVLLTALEFVNPQMPATVDAAALVQMNRRGQIAGAYLEGPLALDVPLSRFAADRKAIDSPVVEATDVFIAPSIEAANILFRAMTYFAGGRSGGIIVGAGVPLILLSRAEPAETKVHSIAIAIMLAHHRRAS
ncbi:MAG TPA: bifunctional enoyl-CoA hydratase/phosphate acetyltransferase, partial [Gaiellaceae bacterium]|nr:bifunctional enoyl-CoA hydratase/phosphate acetyltransferase [Gaiellaceae bacterium]